MPIKHEGRCPHDRVQDCPLYVAGHVPGLPTCMTGDWAYGCSVERGEAAYARLIQACRVAAPRLVAECEWSADLHQRSEQRRRNLRAARIH